MNGIKDRSIERELIGHITTINGTRYGVYLPALIDILQIKMEDEHGHYKLFAIAVGIPYEDFIRWPITDAVKVGNILNKAMENL